MIVVIQNNKHNFDLCLFVLSSFYNIEILSKTTNNINYKNLFNMNTFRNKLNLNIIWIDRIGILILKKL